MRTTLLKFTTVTSLACLVTACGGGSGSNIPQPVGCPNVAQPVALSTNSLATGEPFQRNIFHDFLQGYHHQADFQNEQQERIIAFLTQKIHQAAGYVGDVSNIQHYQNALDFLENVLAENAINNFTEGRKQMLFAVSEQTGCVYNNQKIQVRDNERTLRYLLDYKYVPPNSDTTGNFISRVIIQFRDEADQPADPGETTGVLFGNATSVASYDPTTFSAEGYNEPLTLLAAWVVGEDELLSISKNYSQQFDIVEWIGYTELDVDGDGAKEQIRRLRFNLDYVTAGLPTGVSQVRVYSSGFERAYIGPQGEILKDLSDEELEQLKTNNPNWKVTPYNDPDYDEESATPKFRYEGSTVSNRL